MSTDLKFDVSALDRASQVFVRLGAAIERFERKLDKLDGKDAKVDVEVGTEKAEREIGQFARNLKRRLEAATSNIPDVDIGADATEAEKTLHRLREEMAALGDAKIGVDVSAEKAMAEIHRIKAELAGVAGDKHAGVDVRANAGAAMGELALINREIDKIDGRKATVKIDVDKSLGDSIVKVAMLGRALGTLAIPAALISSLPTVAALGAAAVQAAGAVALIPAAGVAAGAAVATLKLGFKGFGDAVGDNPKKAAEALAKLAPAARETAKEVSALAPAWRQVQQAVQQRLFDGLAAQLKSISGTYLPYVRDALTGVAAGFNTTALSVGKLLTAPRTVSAISDALANVRSALQNALGAVRPFLSAFIDMAAVGSKFLPALGTGLANVATKFANFIAQARNTGALADFIQGGITAIGQLGRIVTNVGSILLSIFRSSQTAGANLLQTLQDLTGGIAAFLRSVQGQSALQSFFGGIRDGIEAIKPGLAALGTAIVGVIKQLGDAGVLKAAGQAFTAIAQQVAPLITMMGNLAGPLATVLKLVGQLAPVLVPAAAALAGLWAAGKLMSGFSSITSTIGGFVTKLRDVGSAAGSGGGKGGGALGAITKLAGGLGTGGILGIALAGVGVALDLYAQKQANAAQAAAEHKSQVDTLAGTLDKLTGSATAATTAQVAQDIAARKLSDGTTSYATALAQAHISLTDYTDAASGNQEALAKVNSELFTGARAALENSTAWSNNKGTYQAAGVTLDELTAAAIGNVQAQDEIQRKLDAQGKGWFAWKSEVQGAVGPLSELGSTLGAFAGTVAEAGEQVRTQAEATRDFGAALETIKPGLAGLKDGAAPLPAMTQGFQALAQSSAVAAQRAGEAAAKFGGVKAGADAAAGAMQASREAFINAATGAGVSADAAAKLADEIGLIPSAAATNFTTNADVVGAQINTLKAQFDAVPGSKSVTVAALTDDAIAKLQTLGFTVEKLPSGEIKVTANTDAALASLGTAVDATNSASGTMHVEGDNKGAHTATVQAVQFADGSHGTVTILGNSKDAHNRTVQEVQFADGSHGTIRILGDGKDAHGKTTAEVTYANGSHGTIKVGADTSAARSAINSVAGAHYTATVHLTANVSAATRAIGSVRAGAQGGIVARRMASGGVLRSQPVLPFAGGGVRVRPMSARRATIVPPNTPRLIGDRVTNDEAFIPINNSARSRSILSATAKAFGYALAPQYRSAIGEGPASWAGSGMDIGPLVAAMRANTGQVRALRGDVDQSALLSAIASRLDVTNRLLSASASGSPAAAAQSNRYVGEMGAF